MIEIDEFVIGSEHNVFYHLVNNTHAGIIYRLNTLYIIAFVYPFDRTLILPDFGW